MDINMSISQKIIELLKIFTKTYNPQKSSFDMHILDEKEFSSLWESIEEDLIQFPGNLIYFQDKSIMESAQFMIDIIWGNMNIDDIFDEMIGGRYTSLLLDIVGDYLERAKLLKPTLIFVDIDNTEFKAYFQEAIRAWLYGLNNSAIILCCSIIENIIKTELWKIDINLAVDLDKDGNKILGTKDKKLETLINNAYDQQIIDKKSKSKAHEIRILRNKAIHKLQKINDKETLKAILDTKDIIENIFSSPSIP